jgi:hypothetical protein
MRTPSREQAHGVKREGSRVADGDSLVLVVVLASLAPVIPNAVRDLKTVVKAK